MNPSPFACLSGFADETTVSKKIDEQFSAITALGLQHVTLRFVDVGSGIKNMMKLDDRELDVVVHKLSEYGLKVSSLGSPIGKVKVADFDDETSNAFVPFVDYLSREVSRAIQLAKRLETKLIRGFSFYPPRGTTGSEYFEIAVRQLRAIAERCDDQGLTFGLEVEANLIGNSGQSLACLMNEVDHPALALVFDGGNLVVQGHGPESIWEQWQLMKPGLGWIHVKDYRREPMAQGQQREDWVDEENLNQFVPADQGDSDYARIFSDVAGSWDQFQGRLQKRGIDQLVVELEPHVRGGGQFGGFSGADGFGVAFRALCKVLDASRIAYRLCGLDDLNQSR